jgi:hypothetical protein
MLRSKSFNPSRLLRQAEAQAESGPPLTQDELTGNLSQLERKLNTEMKCPAGRNQVYIRSLLGQGRTTRPRIAMKCQLRKLAGLSLEIYYEEIRSTCCANHEQCPAWQKMKDRFMAT